MTDNTNFTNLTNTTFSDKDNELGEFMLTGFVVIISAVIILLILERIFGYNHHQVVIRRIENIELDNIQSNGDNPQINFEPIQPNQIIEDHLPSYDEIIVQEH